MFLRRLSFLNRIICFALVHRSSTVPGGGIFLLCCAPYQNWADLSKQSPVRSIRHDDPIDDPFWPGQWPFQGLSTVGTNPYRIKPDPAHTYAISGWGTSLGASSLLLLLRLGVFQDATIPSCLDRAFELFRDYCRSHGKTTSITEFSLKMLKIDSFLVASIYANAGPYIALSTITNQLPLACVSY